MAALPENDRIAGPFLASAGQVDFPADFPLIKAEALRVRRERAGVSSVLSGASLSARDIGPDGFTCRLVEPSLENDRVWVFSALPPSRDRAHTPNGAIRTPTLEGDAEDFQAQLQEARRDLSTALRGAAGETVGEIPFDRAFKFLAFDDQKRPIAAEGVIPGIPTTSAAAQLLADPTFAEMLVTLGAVPRTYQALPTAPVRDVTAKILSDVRSVQDYCFDATVAGKAAVNVSNLNTALAQGANISLFGAEGKRFDFDGTVVVPEGASIQGPPSSRVVLKPIGGHTKFLSVAGDFTTLSGMYIDNSAFGGAAIRFDKAGDLQEVRIHDIQMLRPKLGIDTRGVTGKWLRTYVDNITAFALEGPMAIIERSWAFNFWGIKGPLTADFNGSLSPNHVAFQGSGGALGVAEGGFYLMAHVLGNAGQPGVTTAQKAYHLIDLPAVWLLPTTTADTCGGRSIFDGCTNLRLPFVEFGLNNDEQVELIDSAFVQGWITTRGRNEVPGAAASKSALKIGAGCSVMDLIVVAYNATGHGIEHADPTATLINIMGGRSRQNTLRGVKTAAGGAFAASSMQITDNGTGGHDLGGALHQILASMNTAGAPMNVNGVVSG